MALLEIWLGVGFGLLFVLGSVLGLGFWLVLGLGVFFERPRASCFC
jgi:hypothetical protein